MSGYGSLAATSSVGGGGLQYSASSATIGGNGLIQILSILIYMEDVKSIAKTKSHILFFHTYYGLLAQAFSISRKLTFLFCLYYIYFIKISLF